MAPLTFANTYNIIAFLSKSDASAGFDQIVDFLNAQVIHYALMVNPSIYVSCIKQFWATALIKKSNDVVKLQALIDRKKIFAELARMGDEKPPPKLTFYKFFYGLGCHLPCHRIGKGFSGVETPLFATILVQPQVATEEQDGEDKVFAAPTSPSPTHELSPPLHEPITIPPQAQPALPSSPPQEQPTTTSTSNMTLLNTLIETSTTLSHKGRIKAIDADEDITLVDIETKVELDAELQGRLERKDDDSAADKEVNAAEPTVFNDKEVTMTMAQTLIKKKAKKARLLDE
nr:hypothetical protein [Tanacetum cinerariifolium]